MDRVDRLDGAANGAGFCESRVRFEGWTHGRGGVMAVKQEIGIEALLHWAYQRQGVMEVLARSRNVRPARNARAHSWMGGGGGGDQGVVDIHPDALTVHQAVCLVANSTARGLVMRYAKTGGRPDLATAAAPRLAPMINAKGKIEQVYSTAGRHAPIYCPVRVVVDLANLAAARLTWCLWAEGVVEAHGMLCSGKLSLDKFDLEPADRFVPHERARVREAIESERAENERWEPVVMALHRLRLQSS